MSCERSFDSVKHVLVRVEILAADRAVIVLDGAVLDAGRSRSFDKRAVNVVGKSLLYAFELGGFVLGEVLFAHRAVIVCDVAFFKAGRIGRRD